MITQKIIDLCSELNNELKESKCELVLYGNKIIVATDHMWNDTNLKINTQLQKKVQFDYPVY